MTMECISPGEMTTTLGAFEWFLFGVAAEMTLQVLRPSERASADGTRGLTGRRARLHATILARAVGFDGTVNVREVYGLWASVALFQRHGVSWEQHAGFQHCRGDGTAAVERSEKRYPYMI
jgi:hypothetical protein